MDEWCHMISCAECIAMGCCYEECYILFEKGELC